MYLALVGSELMLSAFKRLNGKLTRQGYSPYKESQKKEKGGCVCAGDNLPIPTLRYYNKKRLTNCEKPTFH